MVDIVSVVLGTLYWHLGS